MNQTLKSRLYFLSLLMLVALASACSRKASEPAKQAFVSSIPKPVSAQVGEGAFVAGAGTAVFADASGEGVSAVGDYAASILNLPKAETRGDKNQVRLALGADAELGDEGYSIEVTPDFIQVTANKAAGLFYAVQTLRQIGVSSTEGVEYAAGTIRDYPSYGWRGSMLDVARHFFGVNDVKRYIDLMAFYKLNVLHLHLSDDQGWRIEIKSWPKLTEIGGKTQVGGKSGGFYTQEQFKDIVAYAQSRFVNIIPEIDMPGHTNAALASYPELNCNGKATELYEGIEVGFSTLCATKPITAEFVDAVVKEMAELTPGPYIHIGGDEASVTKKEDYIAFIRMFKKIVEAHGKHMIGWEEIAQSDIGAGDIAQHWHSKEHAAEASKKGAKVLLSPATKVYLDMKYDTTTKLGLNWAAFIEVDASYNWKVEDMVPGIDMNSVVGIESPIWTETLSTMDELEYMLFPRLPGVAELAWTPGEHNWDEYKVRLGRHGKKMTELGIDFYHSPKVPWTEAVIQ